MSQRIAHIRAVQLRLGRACAAELSFEGGGSPQSTKSLWPSTRSPGRPGQAVQDSSSSSRTTLSSWARLAAALGGLRSCGGGPTKSRCCQVRQAPPKHHVVLMLTAGAESEVPVWPSCLVCPWPAPTSKHCQPAAGSTRPDDDNDDHNAAASTTTTRRRRGSQAQVGDAGGRVAEHEHG